MCTNYVCKNLKKRVDTFLSVFLIVKTKIEFEKNKAFAITQHFLLN